MWAKVQLHPQALKERGSGWDVQRRAQLFCQLFTVPNFGSWVFHLPISDKSFPPLLLNIASYGPLHVLCITAMFLQLSMFVPANFFSNLRWTIYVCFITVCPHLESPGSFERMESPFSDRSQFPVGSCIIHCFLQIRPGLLIYCFHIISFELNHLESLCLQECRGEGVDILWIIHIVCYPVGLIIQCG